MNRTLPLFIGLLLLITLAPALATTFTVDTDAGFQAGNTTAVNSTNNSISLPWVNGTDYNSSGTYTSDVFDLGNNPASIISWNYTSPTGTSVLVATRSGNTTNTGVTGWGSWSSDYATSSGSLVTSTALRYLQFRVQLAATNTSNTAIVTAVSIESNESNTTFSGSGANLTGNTSGDFTFTTTVGATYAIVNVTGRYRINTTGTWSNTTLLNATSATVFPFVITEPSGGWGSFDTSTLYIDINATLSNGTVEVNENNTFVEAIDFVNTVPTIDPILNVTALQNTSIIFTMTASDVDNQVLTFTTNQTGATVTALTNLSARFNWTPNGSEVGFFTILVTVNDTNGTATSTFTANVSDVNDAPELDEIGDIDGYYGVRQFFELSATDLDTYQNLTFSMSPPFFHIITMNHSVNSSTVSSTVRYGWANVTPLDDERGVHNVTFFVSDGLVETNVTSLVSVDYCGDAVCQTTYETTATCAVDCADDTLVPGIALVAPDRNCVNVSMKITAYDAQDRYSCYLEGRVTEGLAVCAPLDGVSITVYATNGSLFTSAASLSTDTSGIASFTPTIAGQYRFIGTKDEYRNATMLVMVRSCQQDIVAENKTTVVQQPPPPLPKPDDEDPEEQQPGITEEDRSLLAIVFFYLVAPLLGACLVYLGNVFYDVNKDTLPWLLAIRIWGYEQLQRFQPQITWLRVKTAPVVNPIRMSLRAIWAVIGPRFEALIAPIIERLKRPSKKP